MSNLSLYNQAFMEVFGISEEQLKNLHYGDIHNWDSIGHINLITALEEAFDLMIDPDDIIDINSYAKGLEVLSEKYNVEF